MSLRKRRKAQLESTGRPTGLTGNTHWATKPKFIQSGSGLFDELFRIAWGMPGGVVLAYLILDFRVQADQVGLTSALMTLASLFAVVFFFACILCIGWGIVRQRSLARSRRVAGAIPSAMPYLGRVSIGIGMVLYLVFRSLI